MTKKQIGIEKQLRAHVLRLESAVKSLVALAESNSQNWELIRDHTRFAGADYDGFRIVCDSSANHSRKLAAEYQERITAAICTSCSGAIRPNEKARISGMCDFCAGPNA